MADAAASLRSMAADLRRAADAAGGGLVRINASVARITASWSGPEPNNFAELASVAAGTIAPWTIALDASAQTLERWAGLGDRVSSDARRAERRLADALNADPIDREVLVRSARSLVGRSSNSGRARADNTDSGCPVP